jgi:pectin methylesterase-like acyl-CoA thioesterase
MQLWSIASKVRFLYIGGLVLVISAGAVVVASVCAGRVQRSANATAPFRISRPPRLSAAQRTRTTSPGEVELITLTANGFEPNEFTRPVGKFLFGVNNRSGVSGLTFRLLQEGGTPHGEKRMAREKVWRKVVNLPPGLYLLSVVDHPEWSCRVTIVRSQ